MTGLKHVMGDYLEESEKLNPARRLTESVFSVSSCAAPLQPTKSMTWEIAPDPNRLKKSYAFNDPSILKDFLVELLAYQERVQHHAKITIDPSEITIEVHTHDVNDITELDKEFAREVDAIFEDMSYYDLSERIKTYEDGI